MANNNNHGRSRLRRKHTTTQAKHDEDLHELTLDAISAHALTCRTYAAAAFYEAAQEAKANGSAYGWE